MIAPVLVLGCVCVCVCVRVLQATGEGIHIVYKVD